jgi:hypothetical protein
MPLGELDWEKKLDMFSSTVQEPTEITTDDLRGMLFKEQKFAESVDRFKKAARKVNYTTEMLRVACRLAGILPGENEPLFDRFVKQIDDEAIFSGKENHLAVAIRSLADLCTDKHLLDYPIRERVIQQPYRKFYYRGEYRRYPSGKPSIYRNTKPESMDLFVRMFKQDEACHALDRIPSVLKWNNIARVDYVAICQHYGLKTVLLDITSSLKTALFFACCRWED